MFILSILTFIGITLQFVFTIQSSIMYSFGPNSTDITLPKIDDGSYGPIRLNFKLKFFNNVYSKMYVNTNGLISFLAPLNKNYPINNYIPISIPFISPFWSDINTVVGGQIYYRESSRLSDLNQSKNDIANIYSTKFNPSRVYIITWDQVSAYNGNSSINNTFQLVIATDGKLKS